MAIELLGADYHRNGVGGAGFYTALFIDPVENPGHTFLATMFVDYICSRCGGTGEFHTFDGNVNTCRDCEGTGEIVPKYVENTAVLDVNVAAKGNIYMHPEFDDSGQLKAEGDNAWRGADSYSAELLPLIRAYLEQSRKNTDLHFALEAQKKEV